MKKIVYRGPEERVTLAPSQITLIRGEPVDVPDDVAARLLNQPGFEKARERKAARGAAAEVNDDVETR